jgi:SAM-dependent methyltransferase
MNAVPPVDQRNLAAWRSARTVADLNDKTSFTDPGEELAVALLAPVARNRPLLDLGVGTGRTVSLLEPLCSTYTALDYTAELVDECRRNHPGVDVRHGDARSLDSFGDATFGALVFSYNGIDAVAHEDRQRIFGEARRVLQPSGALLLSTHNLLGPGARERPWRFPVPDLRYPRVIVRNVIRFPKRATNYACGRRLRDAGMDWSVRPAGAHDFGIVIHYETLAAAFRSLRDPGFDGALDVFANTDGRVVAPDSPVTDVWWFHIVARVTAS